MTKLRSVALDEILADARRLPRKAQVELAETLLRDVELPTLPEMSEAELVALSRVAIGTGSQRRMKALLRRNTEGKLSDREQTELDALLEEADRIALLKAKATYTLSLTTLSACCGSMGN